MKMINNEALQKFPFILFTIFMFFETCVFLLCKATSVNAEGSGISYYIHIIKEPWLWMVLGLSIIQLFLWQKLLEKSELSLVYSLSSLSYPLTMILSNYIFKENLHLFVWIGGALISLGVLLIGSHSK
jgi:uncharacterized membrane protein